MSFDDDAQTLEPPRPTHVLYRCRRCAGDLNVAMPNPSITIREAVEHHATLRVHECDDGAQGIADLIGSEPGRWPPKVPQTPDGT